MASKKGIGYDKLYLPADYYRPEYLRMVLQDKDEFQRVVQEYNRLRAVARERLKSFERAGMTSSAAYQYNKDRYKSLRDITKSGSDAADELAHLLPDLERMLTAQRGSVRGIKAMDKQVLESLHDNGYDFVTKKNLQQFGEFMEDMRSKGIARAYGSKRVAEAFGEVARGEKTAEEVRAEFEAYTAQKATEAAQPKIGGGGSSRRYHGKFK